MDKEFPGVVIVTRDDEVLSSAPCDLARLMSCTHEEADIRMFVHASDGAEHGMNKILPRTVDTYVKALVWRKRMVVTVCGSHFVLALHSGILTPQLWLKHLATLNAMARAFHALTGCDVT